MLMLWSFVLFSVAPIILSFGVRLFIWHDFELAPFDLIVAAIFLPIAAFYAWTISSRRAVAFRRKALWITCLALAPSTFVLFLVLSAPIDQGGYMRVFGGIILGVIFSALLLCTLWLSFNLRENPDQKRALMFRWLAVVALFVLAVLVGITTYKVVI